MDKDKVAGSAKEAKGAIKQAAGKITGDSKLQAEGAADKAVGKVQNAVGGAKRRHPPGEQALDEIVSKARLPFLGGRAFLLAPFYSAPFAS